jgi:hypothetical protein
MRVRSGWLIGGLLVVIGLLTAAPASAVERGLAGSHRSAARLARDLLQQPVGTRIERHGSVGTHSPLGVVVDQGDVRRIFPKEGAGFAKKALVFKRGPRGVTQLPSEQIRLR